jgi:PAS domain S-box-containing protein
MELLRELEALHRRVQELENKNLQADVRLGGNTEAALNEGEQRYRTLAEAAFEGVVISENGVIADLNHQLAEMSGYTRGELLGKSVMTLVAPESRQDVAEAILTNRLEPYEFMGLRKDGRVFPLEVRARMTWISNRQLRVAAIRDITEQKQTESVLRASESKFSIAFHTSPDSININRLEDGLYLDVNQGFTEITGYTWEDVRGKTSLEINIWAHPEDRVRLIEGLRARGVVKDLEATFRMKDGQERAGLMSARIIEINGHRCILSVTRDISERKQMEQSLRRTNELLQALINASPVAIDMVDNSGNVQLWSPTAERFFGWKAAEVIGHPLPFITHGKQYELQEQIEEELRGMAVSGQETQRIRKDGSVMDVELWTAPLHDSEGAVMGSVGVMTDITERKKAEQQIQALHSELLVAYDETLEGWSRALNLRDPNTDGHSRRVVDVTINLARNVGIPESELIHVRRGAILHDIGKMGIPDHILLKPGPLTTEEWRIMQLHPVFAYEMLSKIPFLKPSLDIPYSHHEKWNGSGYPRRLKTTEIPLAARVFAIVDTFDALTSDRSYRPAWKRVEALAYIHDQAGIQFDPEVVRVFLEMVS